MFPLKPKSVIEAGPALKSKRAGGSDHSPGAKGSRWVPQLNPRAPPRDHTQISKTHAPQIYLLDFPSAIFHTTPNSGQRFEAAILGPVAHHVSRIGREGMHPQDFIHPNAPPLAMFLVLLELQNCTSWAVRPQPSRCPISNFAAFPATIRRYWTISRSFGWIRRPWSWHDWVCRSPTVPARKGNGNKFGWKGAWRDGRARPLHSRPSIPQHCISSQTAAPTSPTTDRLPREDEDSHTCTGICTPRKGVC